MTPEQLREQFLESSKINHENFETYFLYLNSISGISLNENIPGSLFLSGRNILNSVDLYEIDHLISVCDISTKISHIQHDVYDIDDKPDDETVQNMQDIIDKVADDIHNSLMNGKRIVVHCKAGQSRSATVVLYYLCKYQFNGDLLKTVDHVVKHRKIICPNLGFIKMLFEFFPV